VDLEQRMQAAIARREEAEENLRDARAIVESIGRNKRASASRELSAESRAADELADAREEEEISRALLAHQRDSDDPSL
jgi:hypothetical protein